MPTGAARASHTGYQTSSWHYMNTGTASVTRCELTPDVNSELASPSVVSESRSHSGADKVSCTYALLSLGLMRGLCCPCRSALHIHTDFYEADCCIGLGGICTEL